MPLVPIVLGALVAATFVSPVRADVAIVSANDEDGSLVSNWLDPEGEFWIPRRGARAEVSFFIGGEAAIGEVAPTEVGLPNFGGATLSPVLRYYPVDSVAIVVGTRGYFGIDRPAAGTGAATVLTPFTGVRYDLVRESRFSLLVDVNSGPTAFVFADFTAPESANPFDLAWALGADLSAALAARYTLGPMTFELRVYAGGRAGTANEIGRPTGANPFSNLYGGVDLGFTYSLWADGNAGGSEGS